MSLDDLVEINRAWQYKDLKMKQCKVSSMRKAQECNTRGPSSLGFQVPSPMEVPEFCWIYFALTSIHRNQSTPLALTWGTEFLLCIYCPLDLLWEFFDDFRTSCWVVDVDSVVVPSGWSAFLHERGRLNWEKLRPFVVLEVYQCLSKTILKIHSVKSFQLKESKKGQIQN